MTFRTMLRLAPTLAAPLALAGCGLSDSSEKQSARPAEILPGSASDAMLPYDSVRSRPPVDLSAETSERTKGNKGAAQPAAGASESAAEKPLAEEAANAAASPAPSAPATGSTVRQSGE